MKNVLETSGSIFWFLLVIPLILFSNFVFAASFGDGINLNLSDKDIAALEAAGKVVMIDGEKKYLIDDLLFTRTELSTRAFLGSAWTGGTIVFQYHADVAGNPNWRNSFLTGCRRWSDVVPNVRCRERTDEANFVEVRTHITPRCVSFSETTGMKGGLQVLSIYDDPNFDSNNPIDGCNLASHWRGIGTIAHEIGHVYGLVHEQSRWDRNSYVNIEWQNLQHPDDEFQFRKFPSTKSTTYTEYDFVSLMHYEDNFYAKPGTRTIVPAVCFVGEVPRIGSQDVVTALDMLGVQHHYGQPIYDMVRERRDAACGTVRVNPSEKRYFCDTLGENCGPGANSNLQSAVTSHSKHWCPGSFDSACSGATGPRRSCCNVPGKEPFNVMHRKGPRRCLLNTVRRHESNWQCGCIFYRVNNRCSMAAFGFNKTKIGEYIDSEDVSLRTLGKFAGYLESLQSNGKLEATAVDGLEELLQKDFGLDFYFKALNDTRYKIGVLESLDLVSQTNPLTRNRFIGIYAKSMAHRKNCYQNALSTYKQVDDLKLASSC